MTLSGASEEEASLDSRNNKERTQYGGCEQEALSLSLSVYPSICVWSREEESSRVLHLCRKGGGGGLCMDVSAAKSDVINVAVA